MLTDSNYENWADDIRLYEKHKRTKKPFGKDFTPSAQIITHKEVKAKEVEYNPLLGTFSDPHMDSFQRHMQHKQTEAKFNMHQSMKYEKDYDIINLHPQDYDPSPIYRRVQPFSHRRNFNIVNNLLYAEDKSKDGMGNFRNFKHRNLKDFDIINNYYYEDHDHKMADEEQLKKNEILDKYWRTHDFNPVITRYYDPDKEEQFQEERKVRDLKHGSKFADRLPNSYKMREEIVIDPSREVPEEVKLLDLKRKNAKKRYETRYLNEYELKQREEDVAVKMENTIRSKLHPKKVQEDEGKTFDIINLQNRQTQLSRPFPRSTWDKVQYTRQAPISEAGSSKSSKLPALHWQKNSIKSGGFEQDI